MYDNCGMIVRGIEIDIVATLNKFLDKNETTYDYFDLNKYLKKIELSNKYSNYDGESNPVSHGFVVIFQFDCKKEPMALLTTGIYNNQYFGVKEFTNLELNNIVQFNDIQHLNNNTLNFLKKNWKNKLILKSGDLKVFNIPYMNCKILHMKPGSFIKNQEEFYEMYNDDFYIKI